MGTAHVLQAEPFILWLPRLQYYPLGKYTVEYQPATVKEDTEIAQVNKLMCSPTIIHAKSLSLFYVMLCTNTCAVPLCVIIYYTLKHTERCGGPVNIPALQRFCTVISPQLYKPQLSTIISFLSTTQGVD